VATVRALKVHGGVTKKRLGEENMAALAAGIANLEKHIENIQAFGLPVVVAINVFTTDTPGELALVEEKCAALGTPVALAKIWAKGGEGGIDLAEQVIAACDRPNDFHYLYDENLSPREKIETIATRIYGAEGVNFHQKALKDLKAIHDLGLNQLLVCMAKTQSSLSDNPALKGRPRGFTLTVREVRICAGAGFLVAITGSIITMPGLPGKPAALSIDVDGQGKISGLF
jgi:formate--tetrahydrofolate ligase